MSKWRRLSRDFTGKIHFLFDQCVPPILRDTRWFMYLPLRLFFGDKAPIFLRFKDEALTLNETALARVYQAVRDVIPQRETDLNDGCRRAILQHALGDAVLEVGCGRGLLAGEMSGRHRVTAVDFVIAPAVLAAYPRVAFVAANAERLPFGEAVFDTVVCAHTLEHIRDIARAIRELRRVARRRVIIVVPKQRPYRYTFDLHLHFFPYPTSLLALMHGEDRHAVCREIGGDLFYVEDVAEEDRVRHDGQPSSIVRDPSDSRRDLLHTAWTRRRGTSA
jgi:ubiquinone/menaquinone biosynthesis C-methylase UbiE